MSRCFSLERLASVKQNFDGIIHDWLLQLPPKDERTYHLITAEAHPKIQLLSLPCLSTSVLWEHPRAWCEKADRPCVKVLPTCNNFCNSLHVQYRTFKSLQSLPEYFAQGRRGIVKHFVQVSRCNATRGRR